MEAKALRSYWQWRNYPPGHNGGGARADAEVLLNTAERQLLAGLSGAEEDVLARALPSWGQEDTKLPAGKNGVPSAAWRTGGAVAGPVAAVRQFHAREGHARVPRKAVETVDGVKLKIGAFLSNARSRAAKLSAERRSELAALGLEWAAEGGA
ncbi:helicase associated domain-containing protein [Streptomyces sp. NPDC090106]|uniref:helicase associated domain-containing protein n=1 Tax=Streptomyces sp. NPDC090106 TaxID=3365946 RepID=UPI00380F5DBE